MGTPFVTSVALLLKGAFPQLNSNEIRRCILDSATPIVLDETGTPHLVNDLKDLSNYSSAQIAFSMRFFGRGRLDAKAALELAKTLS